MPEAYSRQSEEGDSQESKAGSEESSLPGTRGLIAVADSSQCNLDGSKIKIKCHERSQKHRSCAECSSLIMYECVCICFISSTDTSCASCSTHSPPPERVCIGVKICVDVLLCQVDKEGGKDQDQKAYVPSSNQLLRDTQTKIDITHTCQQQQLHLYLPPCHHYWLNSHHPHHI